MGIKVKFTCVIGYLADFSLYSSKLTQCWQTEQHVSNINWYLFSHAVQTQLRLHTTTYLNTQTHTQVGQNNNNTLWYNPHWAKTTLKEIFFVINTWNCKGVTVIVCTVFLEWNSFSPVSHYLTQKWSQVRILMWSQCYNTSNETQPITYESKC